ncbi:MAG TPA: hypothetical protein VFD92_02055 [Candidatus Binatia bacterium]|nr:hypothetical protein [Candidatus Binatia bacterium]
MNTAIKGRIGMLALALAAASLPATASAAVKIKSSASGRVLTITGDRADDEVSVSVTPEADAIAVLANGEILGGFLAGSIESIRIRLGGGSDSLSVELGSQGRLGLRMVSINLGGGDDYAILATDPGVVRSVSGGPGEDTVSGSGSAADFRSVEHVVSFTALVSNGGAGGLGYECKTDTIDGSRYCVCDASDPWDCWNMFVDKCVLSPETAEELSKCIKGTITTHCTCTPRALLIIDDPIFRFPPDAVFTMR